MIDQLGIALFGVTAVAMTQMRRGDVRRWAPVFGLCSQPFWFHATYVSEQWGIFALCLVYAAIWVRGFYNSWCWVE